MTLVERRDPEKTYNLRTTAALEREAPGFDWKAYFAAIGAAGSRRGERRAAEVRRGLRRASPPRAPPPTGGPTCAGRCSTPPRPSSRASSRRRISASSSASSPGSRIRRRGPSAWSRRSAGVTAASRSARRSGEIFVAEAFPPEAKARALELVGNVKAALRERLLALDWMEESTRRAALEKLDRMAVKIGYPDHWRDFSVGAGRRAPLRRELDQRQRLRIPPHARAPGQARGPRRVVDGAPHRERVLRIDPERDRVPRRHPAAAVLRPEGRRRGELRRHRHGDRPRDHARLRRPGPPLRCRGQPSRMVDAGRPQALRGARPGHRHAVRRLRRASTGSR